MDGISDYWPSHDHTRSTPKLCEAMLYYCGPKKTISFFVLDEKRTPAMLPQQHRSDYPVLKIWLQQAVQQTIYGTRGVTRDDKIWIARSIRSDTCLAASVT